MKTLHVRPVVSSSVRRWTSLIAAKEAQAKIDARHNTVPKKRKVCSRYSDEFVAAVIEDTKHMSYADAARKHKVSYTAVTNWVTGITRSKK